MSLTPHPVEQLTLIDRLADELRRVVRRHRAAMQTKDDIGRQITWLADERFRLTQQLNRAKAALVDDARTSAGDDAGRAILMAGAVAEMVGPPVPEYRPPATLLLYVDGRCATGRSWPRSGSSTRGRSWRVRRGGRAMMRRLNPDRKRSARPASIRSPRRRADAGGGTPIPAAPPLPPDASAGKRWRWKRDLTIFVCHRAGLSQRHLADVFDLPRSRIHAILKAFRGHLTARGLEPGDELPAHASTEIAPADA